MDPTGREPVRQLPFQSPRFGRLWTVSGRVSFISSRFGTCSVDRFASQHNAKLPRFNAFYWCPEAEACNAFTQDWGADGRSYCFPPPHLVARTLQHARACRAHVTLVVLGWRTAPWWPLLCCSVESGRGFAPFVRGQLFFPQSRRILVPGLAPKDQFCGFGVPLCDIFALDVDFSTSEYPIASLYSHFSRPFCRCLPTRKLGPGGVRPSRVRSRSPSLTFCFQDRRPSFSSVRNSQHLCWPLGPVPRLVCFEEHPLSSSQPAHRLSLLNETVGVSIFPSSGAHCFRRHLLSSLPGWSSFPHGASSRQDGAENFSPHPSGRPE